MYFYTSFYAYKNDILVRGYRGKKRFKAKIKQAPYIFVRSKNSKSEFRTLDGESVERMDFESVWDAREFINNYKDVHDFKMYGSTDHAYVYINNEFTGEIDYDPNLISVVTIDIEVAADEGFPDIYRADKPITAISCRKNGKSVVLGCGEYTSNSKEVTYVKCVDEKNLLGIFLNIMNHPDWAPDVLTGWNIEHFDIPYLYNRIVNLLGVDQAKKLSPWEMVNEREIVRGKSASRGSKNIEERIDKIYDIVGVATLDYLEIYKKFSFSNQESYRLDHIANLELGEKKVDYSEYESLLELYKKDYQKFIDYNIHDVVLVDRLEDKLGFIKQIFAIAYDAKVNYTDTFTTVKPWDVIIHNYLYNKKIVIPFATKNHNGTNFAGGFVKEPQVGMHKWVVSLDLNSLYPHLIMQYNISPETFAKYEITPDVDKLLDEKFVANPEFSNAANGCRYRKDKQGFLPEIMEKMYNDRVLYKKKMLEAKQEYEKNPSYELEKAISRYHNLQFAKKIQLNSAYGALGNQYFRWYDLKHAEAITHSGQLAIRWIEKKMNAFMNKTLKTEDIDYVIASDTDSIYVRMEGIVNAVYDDKLPDDKTIVKTLDKFIEAKVQPYIDKSYQELSRYMNAYSQKMFMKREAIADKGIWTAKKKYILNVWNQEGVMYEKPKLKMMGIEAVRSSTPGVCRDRIKKALDIIMNSDNDTLIKFIDEFRSEFYSLPYEDVAFPRGCKGMSDYQHPHEIYKKGTPIHVRGALLYNKMLKDKKVKTVQPIRDGDKIKFCYLKLPNPIHENVISTLGPLPKQFELDKYIDYPTQFQKSFIDPIDIILSTIGWSHERKAQLDMFWS